MAIRAILYDLDGTLRISRPAGSQFFADQAAQLGVHLTEQKRRQAARWEHYYWAQSPEKILDHEMYPNEAEFWINYGRRYIRELGGSLEQIESLPGLINRHMRENYRPKDELMDGIHETLGQLRSRGLILGVISNRDKPFGEYLEDLGIAEYFDFSLAAGEVNAWKPEKEVFLYALEQLNLLPSETMYVGDNYFADVIGARNAGLEPVLIDPDLLFDSPGCIVIQSHPQILEILERSESWPGNGK